MGKQRLTLELDEETIRSLGTLGSPAEVLASLAKISVGAHPPTPRRDQTDLSLQSERTSSDADTSSLRKALEDLADEVVRIARQRADQVLKTAREDADRLQPEDADHDSSARTQADRRLRETRSVADAVLLRERGIRANSEERSVAVERKTTDGFLTGERIQTDAMLLDQRSANEQLVLSGIRLQELSQEADEARERAETSERGLRELAEFRELFIGIVGHDLRNPLASMLVSAALLLRRGNLNEKDAEGAAKIIRGGQRMTTMITQLLDLTRTRLGGGLPIEPKPLDLGTLCHNVVDEFEARIQLELEGELVGAWDGDRLEQVLSNLAGNAIEHAAPGTAVQVKVRGEGDEVVVEVINQGSPIPPETLPFIFEPFRRGKQHAPANSTNLGLGLYIARQIVLAHGGTVEARSAGGLTTFTIRLPRQTPPVAGATPST
ncbi:MAG: HAMP domain-containing histidine kinase [Myxococcota bacterium]|nr:HAMP domain-containing histidine kinase [Myxococcota bacterium]